MIFIIIFNTVLTSLQGIVEYSAAFPLFECSDYEPCDVNETLQIISG